MRNEAPNERTQEVREAKVSKLYKQQSITRNWRTDWRMTEVCYQCRGSGEVSQTRGTARGDRWYTYHTCGVCHGSGFDVRHANRPWPPAQKTSEIMPGICPFCLAVAVDSSETTRLFNCGQSVSLQDTGRLKYTPQLEPHGKEN